MAIFGVADADNYGGQGGAGFFSLKNDHDVARVRFLYNGIEDVQGYAVHQVEIDGKKRYVNCLREYGQPVDACPFCAAKLPVYVKYFIPLYNIDADKIQVWERGKKFGQKISSICSRYPNLVSHTFEIERNGVAGDQQTTYEIYEVGSDNTTLDAFTDDMPDVLGGVILDKTPEELEYYLNRGSFPNENGDGGNPSYNRQGATPVVRRGGGDVRRTPSNNGVDSRRRF